MRYLLQPTAHLLDCTIATESYSTQIISFEALCLQDQPTLVAEAETIAQTNDSRQVIILMADSAAKLTPPASPTASFYDLSDDEEGEYNTIMHSSSGRGVKLLFSKSKVCTTSSTHRAYKD